MFFDFGFGFDAFRDMGLENVKPKEMAECSPLFTASSTPSSSLALIEMPKV